MPNDIAITIMRERVFEGVAIAKEAAKQEGLPMTQEILIKGMEIGISLFIQKETARRVPNYQK